MAAVKKLFKSLWKNDIIRLGTILFLISAVASFLLGFVNLQTKDIIANSKKSETGAAMRAVMPAADAFSSEPVSDSGGVALYLATKGGAPEGFCAQVAPNGYAGPVSILVGISLEGSVTGVEIVAMSETPGIGSQTQSPEFLSQFQGKKKGVGIGAGGDSNIDAISGATITSTAVTKGVSAALDAVAAYEGGGVK